MFGFSTVVMGVLYFFDLGLLTYLAVFLAGLAASALLPLMLTFAGLVYREIAGTVLGTIKVAIPIGGIVIPFLMSTIVRYSTFHSSLWVFPLAYLIAFALLYVAFNQDKSRWPIQTG
jgi:MFS family permease